MSRVESRSVKPYWTLLFSDILLFAKVSRDRVLFITEEPIALTNITDSCFNIRKKSEWIGLNEVYGSKTDVVRFFGFISIPPRHRVPNNHRPEWAPNRKPDRPLRPGPNPDAQAQLQEALHRDASTVGRAESRVAEPADPADVSIEEFEGNC